MATMRKAVSKCQRIVCFSDELKETFLKHFIECKRENVVVIYPSVLVDPTQTPSQEIVFNFPYFLLPTGIREVKDPTYLFNVIEKRAKETLIICGPILSAQCFEDFERKLKGKSHIRYLGNLSGPEVHYLMQHCVALVNCSLSEGLSNAILEALALNVVVMARKIPGNEAVISDGENGILFEDELQFIEKIAFIDKIEKATLSERNELDMQEEKRAYNELLETVFIE